MERRDSSGSEMSLGNPGKRISTAVCWLLFMTGCSGMTPTSAWQEESLAVDELFEGIATEGTPGCAVGAIHQGEYIHKAGYGMANLEHDIPISASSVFRVGSVSKQFTAMAIAILAERGELDLDADVHTYLPELQDYGHEVTVRQMVHHVSGMADYSGADDVFPTPRVVLARLAEAGLPVLERPELRETTVPQYFGNGDHLTADEFYAGLAMMGLRTPPETEFYYSNAAYVLLWQLAERVSGRTLREFTADEIFGPLGMEHSLFVDDGTGIVPRRTDGYRKTETGAWHIDNADLDLLGDGGVFTTIDDFILWDQNFYDNKLGSGGPALMDIVLSTHPVAWRNGSQYAFGLSIGEYQGHRRVSHGGSWVGYRANYERFPDLQFSVVTLCNFASAMPWEYSERVVDVYLPSLSSAGQTQTSS